MTKISKPVSLKPTPDLPEEAKQFLEELKQNICPRCHLDIVEYEQIGRCVYAKPCGHRLGTGTVR